MALEFFINTIAKLHSKKYRCVISFNLVSLKAIVVVINVILSTFYSPSCFWPGDNKGTFRSSSQAATCLPHSVEASHCPLIAERQAGKL